MTLEQFLSAVGDIDDKFLTRFALVSDNISSDIFEDNYGSEKPQIFRFERGNYPVLRPVIFTASLVFVLAFGIFGIIKLRGILPADPVSNTFTSNSGSNAISNTLSNTMLISEKINLTKENGYEFRTDFLGETEHNFDHIETEHVIKTDDNNFAVLCFDFLDMPDFFSLCVQINVKYYMPDEDSYTYVPAGKIIINNIDDDICLVEYTMDVKPGDELYLTLYAYGERIISEGKWLP